MARKEIKMEELVEVLYQWHKGQSIRGIKRSIGMDRKTISKYIDMAESYGLSRDMEIQEYQYYMRLAGKIQEGLKTPVATSASYKKTALYQVTIEKLMAKKYITRKQAYKILNRDYEYPLSYGSFNRYMNVCYPKQERNCLRLEVKPGEEAQVDFGSAGKMYDPKTEQDKGTCVS